MATRDTGYHVILLRRDGSRETVHQGTSYTAATTFFAHVMRACLGAIVEGSGARVRPADYHVRIEGPDGREVAYSEGRAEDLTRPWSFAGYSETARLAGCLRTLPVNAGQLLGGNDRANALLRAAAEGRRLSPEGAQHVRSRLAAARTLLRFVEERVLGRAGAEGAGVREAGED